MIDHSGCDHPSTPGARARCRRAQTGGSSGGERIRNRATRSRGVSWSGPLCGEEGCIHGSCYRIRHQEVPELVRYGQTPGKREDECHSCHVEKIEFIGTDNHTGRTLMVGERCAWRVKRSPDFRALRL